MNCESEAAGVWAALLALSFFIAVTIALGYQLCVYHHEAAELQPYLIEPTSAAELFLNDLPLPLR